MKLKIITLILFSFLILFFVPNVFAENVRVMGGINSNGITTVGSSLVFKDSVSQKIIQTETVDSMEKYYTSIPQGTYDITIIPKSDSGLSSKTDRNLKIEHNTTYNITLPVASIYLSISNNLVLYIVVIAVIVFLISVGIIYFLRIKRTEY